MRSRTTRRWVLFLTGLIATFLVSCSQNSGSPPTNPGVTGTATSSEYLGLLAQSQTFQSVVSDHDLTIINYDKPSGLMEFSTTTDLSVLEADPRLSAVGGQVTASLADDANLIVAFSEGDWEDYEDQGAFDCLQLDAVHAYASGNDVTVAILDTGLDTKHPHLIGHFKLVNDPVLGTGVESAADGIDNDFDGSTDEAFGHGTHVAGIVATLAPDAEIIPIRVLNDDGRGTDFDVARGLYAALSVNADVVNLSLTLSQSSPVVEAVLDQLEAAGIFVVAAAGNQSSPAYPATHPWVYGAAASGTGVSGESCTHLWSGSASGASDVAFAGVGYAVSSAYPTAPGQVPKTLSASGTSVGSAVVTGAFALMLSTFKQSVPALVDPIGDLEQNAIPLSSGSVAFGHVDPHAALGIGNQP